MLRVVTRRAPGMQFRLARAVSSEGAQDDLPAAAHEQPHGNEKKNDRESIAGHLPPAGRCKKCLQRTRQQHDKSVHEGGDSDIDGHQHCQFAYRRRGSSDEFRNNGDEEQRSLRIEEVSDKSVAELR